ncbi:APC family permease [Sulfurovum mangrovi]|uniref:APC family permease n=1 Tax=Sulfurovum mangrovi TaxID=2893889 RepID=UPI001E5AB018|nr:APC family permease [Sulfurovum mangrovi]UFH58144.1 APC family permease [Sulfurovum mangrovi]
MKSNVTNTIYRSRDKNLGVPELVAIALGGMIGGGIFTVLGISVALIGVFTPLAFLIGGVLAYLAAYSYIKLGVYYKDEGATYSFFKKTFSDSAFAASLIGWWVIFGYISTLALYAYTFSSYAISGFAFGESEIVRKAVAGGIILLFTLINLWSVKGMGKIEDLMVYIKLVILVVISFVLINNSNTTIPTLLHNNGHIEILSILIVASLTFVAFEGFQLVINAVNEMEKPQINIPKAIYIALTLAMVIYFILSYGAIVAIPLDDIIANQEYALAAGANDILGHWGTELVIVGALLATSSAISGTVFGASRQIAVIAKDGYFPSFLAQRKNHIPLNAIIAMSLFAFLLILIGDLKVILEFGSVTFLLVSLLMAFANLKIHKQTSSSLPIIWFTIAGLFIALMLILYFEYKNQIEQLYFIGGIYTVLTLGAILFSWKKRNQ